MIHDKMTFDFHSLLGEKERGKRRNGHKQEPEVKVQGWKKRQHKMKNCSAIKEEETIGGGMEEGKANRRIKIEGRMQILRDNRCRQEEG